MDTSHVTAAVPVLTTTMHRLTLLGTDTVCRQVAVLAHETEA